MDLPGPTLRVETEYTLLPTRRRVESWSQNSGYVTLPVNRSFAHIHGAHHGRRTLREGLTKSPLRRVPEGPGEPVFRDLRVGDRTHGVWDLPRTGEDPRHTWSDEFRGAHVTSRCGACVPGSPETPNYLNSGTLHVNERHFGVVRATVSRLLQDLTHRGAEGVAGGRGRLPRTTPPTVTTGNGRLVAMVVLGRRVVES